MRNPTIFQGCELLKTAWCDKPKISIMTRKFYVLTYGNYTATGKQKTNKQSRKQKSKQTNKKSSIGT